MKRLKPIMFVGTGSDVGKSVVNAAFCRIFKQDGYTPAPFKAQNMSLNSYPTKDGLEIGRAQAVQADACKIECKVEMNPILLKPVSNQTAQIVLNGKPIGNQSAKEYFNGEGRNELLKEAVASYQKLNELYNPIVIEGAGSISEINLWDRDITNMKIALAAGASTYLIADIDKGGVFASVYGTIELLPQEEKELIKGIIINKFRGDIDLFKDGAKMLEDLTGKPVVGIIPYFRDIDIEQEDSVVLDSQNKIAQEGFINIAIVLLPHMSNFTDFNTLERISNVHLYYAAKVSELQKADIIIIPGSKNTIGDMGYLRNSGMAKEILSSYDAGKQVYGICGGYQMMGKEIRDPYHLEGDIEVMPGLNILPITSVLGEEKVTKQCEFSFLDVSTECKGYEIHMGETKLKGGQALCEIKGSGSDGCFLSPKVWGTYIHGVFDNQQIISYILNQTNKTFEHGNEIDYQKYKDEQFDKLAAFVRENVDMEKIYKSINQSDCEE